MNQLKAIFILWLLTRRMCFIFNTIISVGTGMSFLISSDSGKCTYFWENISLLSGIREVRR